VGMLGEYIEIDDQNPKNAKEAQKFPNFRIEKADL
jgi:hypothetical protein